ncbi:collagen alpha-1(I) chain-like [Lathamus discolor]|uniref:collagen alpha-1(I) chain-like n=1 Tax=Lathamus discolor TaxID=678569 RepID=UPI0032B8782D
MAAVVKVFDSHEGVGEGEKGGRKAPGPEAAPAAARARATGGRRPGLCGGPSGAASSGKRAPATGGDEPGCRSLPGPCAAVTGARERRRVGPERRLSPGPAGVRSSPSPSRAPAAGRCRGGGEAPAVLFVPSAERWGRGRCCGFTLRGRNAAGPARGKSGSVTGPTGAAERGWGRRGPGRCGRQRARACGADASRGRSGESFGSPATEVTAPFLATRDADPGKGERLAATEGVRGERSVNLASGAASLAPSSRSERLTVPRCTGATGTAGMITIIMTSDNNNQLAAAWKEKDGRGTTPGAAALQHHGERRGRCPVPGSRRPMPVGMRSPRSLRPPFEVGTPAKGFPDPGTPGACILMGWCGQRGSGWTRAYLQEPELCEREPGPAAHPDPLLSVLSGSGARPELPTAGAPALRCARGRGRCYARATDWFRFPPFHQSEVRRSGLGRVAGPAGRGKAGGPEGADEAGESPGCPVQGCVSAGSCAGQGGHQDECAHRCERSCGCVGTCVCTFSYSRGCAPVAGLPWLGERTRGHGCACRSAPGGRRLRVPGKDRCPQPLAGAASPSPGQRSGSPAPGRASRARPRAAARGGRGAGGPRHRVPGYSPPPLRAAAPLCPGPEGSLSGRGAEPRPGPVWFNPYLCRGGLRHSLTTTGLPPGHRRPPDGAGRPLQEAGSGGGAARGEQTGGPRGQRRPWRMALPPRGVTPAPAPRPACPSPAARALSPPAAPSLLPPSPALQPSLRRRLCLNFSGRSRRRRGAGEGPAPALAPGGIIQPPSRPEPPPYPATAWEGCGDPEPTATAGSTGPSRESRYPPSRDPFPGTPSPVASPGPLPGVPSPLPVPRLGPGAASPPSFPQSCSTAGASRLGQFSGSIPRRCPGPVPGASRPGRKIPEDKGRRGRGLRGFVFHGKATKGSSKSKPEMKPGRVARIPSCPAPRGAGPAAPHPAGLRSGTSAAPSIPAAAAGPGRGEGARPPHKYPRGAPGLLGAGGRRQSPIELPAEARRSSCRGARDGSRAEVAPAGVIPPPPPFTHGRKINKVNQVRPCRWGVEQRVLMGAMREGKLRHGARAQHRICSEGAALASLSLGNPFARLFNNA